MISFIKPKEKASLKHSCSIALPDSLLIYCRALSCDLKFVPTKSFYGHNYALGFVDMLGDCTLCISFHIVVKVKSETVVKLDQFSNGSYKLGIKVASIQSNRCSDYFGAICLAPCT